MAEIDYVEVGRAAHELVASHGAHAAGPYAAKLAKRAKDTGNADEQAFWEAVVASLEPR
jgi:hypothetical protein